MFIVTAKEMYDIDHYTISEIGLEGKLLMENAGRAIYEKVVRKVGEKDRIKVIVGSGNNGGDGFVIARTLQNNQYHVSVVQVVPDEKIKGDALVHKQIYIKFGGKVNTVSNHADLSKHLADTDVIIDAMFGIGITGKLREPFATMVSMINNIEAYVISVDIPSGLPADEGLKDFVSVQADYTVVIEAPKISAFLQHTSSYYGEWEVVTIGIPLQAFQTNVRRVLSTERAFVESLPKRKPFAHKGNHGRGLVVGGNSEMPGAVGMSAKAALRAGAGLISIGTSKDVASIIASQCFEATFQFLAETNGFLTDETEIPFHNFDAIAIGVGLGREPQTRKLVKRIVHDAQCPLIIDADGLYHIKNELSVLKQRTKPTILTPHPGEMARLLDITVSDLLVNPFRYSLEFAREYNVFLVLKGKYTIITAPTKEQAVNITGNPGLAKGGSGDVLTGISLAMVMQGQPVFRAICNACYLHGRSADLQVNDSNSERDLMATDVIDGISKVYRTYTFR
ncbi:NAD(P)H-hydrate dehydratase [Ornithinibacillus sp. L9]|uniref:Bifunctional NAD(P)H-hydrate repair enzyme n=1 Tax=Ornithinibacillus caprae TaxID=2678566 RepID=A0A6N8FPF8_9BACI|nr:NAD(P)H-hydrate dehydratase [Ornithinibacillus caprae]